MSLLLWLPLNGDTRNQGLTNATVGNTGATVSNSGKTGSCYSFNGTSSYFQVNGLDIDSKPCLSICFGVLSNSGDLYGSFIIRKSSTHQLTLNTTGLNFRDSKHSSLTSIAFTQPTTGVWTHYAIVYDNGSWIIYKDGTEVTRQTYAAATLNSGLNEIRIGRAESTSENKYFNGRLNDFRIYDHALSQKEVSELSKGLILHYKFAAMLNEGNGNLVKNGWGGLENWTNTAATAAVTTEVPSGLGITHSYTSSNMTKEYIPIIGDHTYTISAYVKKNKGSYCYISLPAYDVDKLEISCPQSEGTYAASLTTLTQPLKSGDTEVHVASASGWKTTGSNYEYIAFFDYMDSTGYLYPPLVYTRNLLRINKADIDKTNNIIPLTSAYTGTTKNAGLSVSQSTAGSGYYYPYAATSANTVDWTLKSVNFVPNNTRRLKAAKYLRVLSLSTYQYLAGITLEDNNANLTVYDDSGFGNNGTIVGTIETKQDCPRPGYSVMIGDGRSNYVKTSMLMPLYQITMNCWVKGSEAGYGTYNMPFDSAAQYEMSIDSSGKFRQGFYINGSRKVVTTASKSVTDGEWHMITATFDGSTIRRYVDGDEVAGSSTSAAGILASGVRNLYIGNYDGGTTYGSKNYSTADARIYATALSAEDIKELYNLGASIDNNGNIYTGELIEV